jgi:proteasome lid subunit RPN8/RPN11
MIMATLRLMIGRRILDFVRRDCEMRMPEEACGLLVGRYTDSAVEVSDVMPVRNMSMSRVRFAVDPMEMFKGLKKAGEQGETIVGVYHSHPSSREPSTVDQKYMAGTCYVWLIVEACRRFGAFVFEDEVVKEVKVEEF